MLAEGEQELNIRVFHKVVGLSIPACRMGEELNIQECRREVVLSKQALHMKEYHMLAYRMKGMHSLKE